MKETSDTEPSPPTYEVLWVRGDYLARQLKANRENCILYVEQHLNALKNDDPATQRDNPALVIVGGNASQTSKNFASWYIKAVSAELDVPIAGVSVGPKRGDANLRYTSMPAVLLEPLFVSDPTQSTIIKSGSGQERLARVLVEGIRRFFPDGGKVAFSVGHKYRDSKPLDRGALVYGGGVEADFAEAILKKAESLLVTPADHATDMRLLRIVKDGQVIAQHAVDADAAISWNRCTETLTIYEADGAA